jgi:hypothetical protein
VVAAALVALGALLAGCGDDDEATPAPTTTSESTTTTTEVTTTTSPPPACGAVVVPEDAEELTEVAGDADGDGTDDALRTYRVGEAWHLQVELAAEGGADLPLPSFGGAVGIIGGADIDGDGADEVWARTGSGASATIVGLARLVDCELVRVAFASGELAELPIGGSVGTTSGLECRETPDDPADLVGYTATLTDGTTYDVAATRFALEGTSLVEQGTDTSTVDALDGDAFLPVTSFRCGDLVL